MARGIAPYKVEAFVWRVLYCRVQIRSELVKRGVVVSSDNCCPLCMECQELLTHLFFSCIVAWKVWGAFLDLWDVSSALPSDPKLFLLVWRELLPMMFTVKFRLVSWLIAKFSDVPFRKEDLFADLSRPTNALLGKKSKLLLHSWSLPSAGTLKFNVGGAMRSDGSAGGIGGALRDSLGELLLSYSISIGSGSPLQAEALAIEYALKPFMAYT
ncbi:hypothetical protein F3Y22_tig00002793pilonHSYRG00114 [Hibiscus syriacus]|uniref:Reverse transcriptase zinc-binding domain-containing protein n=1 Tax=Hibiscus syriacus TaxID=106335 RepID=A0A6A3CWA6_HIBSY|nr:hypothetical protein F3Y22_tig00002793pilonHSYRG00114 [Hibiscus syriacus]